MHNFRFRPQLSRMGLLAFNSLLQLKKHFKTSHRNRLVIREIDVRSSNGNKADWIKEKKNQR